MRPPLETLMVRIVRKSRETSHVCVFELAAETGGALPSFSAGAHVDVHLPGGLLRQYSLCNDPRETHRYVIGVLRDPSSRGGSSAMHDHTKEGDVLKISLPRNHFPLHPSAHTLLFAGGIGVTPLLSMAEHLAGAGRDFVLHYCTRSQEQVAFLARLRAARFSDKVFLHFDDGEPSQQLDTARALANGHDDARLYVCGPNGFIDGIKASAAALGWSSDRVHSETFSPAATGSEGSEAFEVLLKKSGTVYRIPPDKSVAVVLAAAGFVIPLSCEAGVCGTCLTPVLDGMPDHRDSFLTDEERAKNDCFTPCCSRALGPRLILDL